MSDTTSSVEFGNGGEGAVAPSSISVSEIQGEVHGILKENTLSIASSHQRSSSISEIVESASSTLSSFLSSLSSTLTSAGSASSTSEDEEDSTNHERHMEEGEEEEGDERLLSLSPASLSPRSPRMSPPPESELSSSFFESHHSSLSPLETPELEWLMKPLSKLPRVEHIWYPKNYSSPKLCNVCREFIWGLANSGYCCEVCSCAIHEQCFENRHQMGGCQYNPCPPSEGTLPKAIDFHRRHHWVEGNNPTDSHCMLCDDPLTPFEDVRCTRCHLTFHAECLAKLAREGPVHGLSICRPEHLKLLYRALGKPQEGVDEEAEEEESNTEVEDIPMPLLVFVNSKSGAQQGPILQRKFRRLLGAAQVFDLAEGGPLPGLRQYKSVPNLHVLVCGGDGSVGWVIQYLFSPEIGYTSDNRPPVSVLPLGTGNDMSQTLGWGIEYAGENLSDFLTEIEQANIVHLDRWSIEFAPSTTLPPSTEKTQPPTSSSSSDGSVETSQTASKTTSEGGEETKEKEETEETKETPTLSILVPKDCPRTVVMNNYLSIGWDAKVSLDFHALRETNSYLCQSRIGNKFLYALYGVKQMVFESGWYLENTLELEVDGKILSLPWSLEGLIVMNLPSYAGGMDLWGPHRGTEEEAVGESTEETKEADKKKEENSDSTAETSSSTSTASSSTSSSSASTSSPTSSTSTSTSTSISTSSSPSPPTSTYHRPMIDDQLLEIVGIAGCLHMGSIQVNLTNAFRIAQGRKVTIRWKKDQTLAMQVDGEPFLQKPCNLTVTHLNHTNMLASRNHTKLAARKVKMPVGGSASSAGNNGVATTATSSSSSSSSSSVVNAGGSSIE